MNTSKMTKLNSTKLNSTTLALATLTSLSMAGQTLAIDLPKDARIVAIHPGAVAFEIHRPLAPSGPLAIYGVVFDRSQNNLKLVTTANADATIGPIARGRSTVSEQANALTNSEQVAVAAINGDFFSMTGTFTGTTSGGMMVNDELFRFVDGRPTFAVLDKDNTPVIGNIDIDLSFTPPTGGRPIDVPVLNRPMSAANDSVNPLALYSPRWGKTTNTDKGTLEIAFKFDGKLEENQRLELQIIDATETGNREIAPGTLVLAVGPKLAPTFRAYKPGQKVKLTTIVKNMQGKSDGGHPMADQMIDQLIGGGPILIRDGKIVQGADKDLHPRSAVAFDDKQIMLITVDGRSPGHSRGMTLLELAEFINSTGATNAINLDGGGSTTMWVRGKVVNWPSDGRERPNPNGLALVSLGGVGEASQIILQQSEPLRVVRGAALQLNMRLADARLNPVADTTISLAADETLASISGTTVTPKSAGQFSVRASAGAVSRDIAIEVVDAPTTLKVEPSHLEMMPGSSQLLSVIGLDGDGHPLAIDPKQIRTEVTGSLASAGALMVIAGQQGGSGEVIVRAYGTETRIPLQIAQPTPLEGYAAAAATWNGFPASVIGKVEAAGDAARLSWDFTKTPGSAASYLVLGTAAQGRDVSGALSLNAKIKAAAGSEKQRVLIKATLVDGNNSRTMYTLFDGAMPADWTDVTVSVPPGMKHPLRWHSIYVVSTDSTEFAQTGAVKIAAPTWMKVGE